MIYHKLTIDQFDIFYKILKHHFPTKELKEYTFLKGLFIQGAAHALVLKEEDEIIGALCYMKVDGYAFIDYFVIIDGYQGQKLGQKMLQYFKETIKMPILLEVELPTDDISKRRIQFYQRQGFILHNYEYVIPPIRSLKFPIRFLLMTYPYKLNEEEYKKIYPRILKIVYGIMKD